MKATEIIDNMITQVPSAAIAMRPKPVIYISSDIKKELDQELKRDVKRYKYFRVYSFKNIPKQRGYIMPKGHLDEGEEL